MQLSAETSGQILLPTPTIHIPPVFTCKKLTWELGPELNESSSEEDTSSSITGSPAKLTDEYKFLPNSRTSEEEDTEVSLPLSTATSLQASTSRENP
ncbi:hypothetical protein AYI68_g7848 [Smittium mucronatum]|uniref:Uncharacterized protein n=1 Tax=Smittium mucronatum TaxID=133383 RepID=A0A1R0GMJ8_9FUNG|nr:hypothetical protein AYI68_g7848 [Smittium mucronatum]